MRTNLFIAGGLVIATLLTLPVASFAGIYKRAGGGAYHERKTCPALSGYKVVEIGSTQGLAPCRVCCKDTYEQTQSSDTGMKLDQPRVLTIQEISGTNKKQDDSNQQESNTVYYDGEYWDPIHRGPHGSFVVSNGQPVRVGPRSAAVVRHGGGGRR